MCVIWTINKRDNPTGMPVYIHWYWYNVYAAPSGRLNDSVNQIKLVSGIKINNYNAANVYITKMEEYALLLMLTILELNLCKFLF